MKPSRACVCPTGAVLRHCPLHGTLEGIADHAAHEAREARKRRRAELAASAPSDDPEAIKVCIDCRVPKRRAEFYAHRASTDGRQSRCKACDNDKRAHRLRESTKRTPAGEAGNR